MLVRPLHIHKRARQIFPGKNFREILVNEFKDFFVTGYFRKEFFLMASYSALLLVFVILVERENYFAAAAGRINLAIFILGAYFLLSDFFKRKHLLPQHLQFVIDSLVYPILMFWIIFLTGGPESPLAFSLLFLTAVSAPLYSDFLQTVVFTVSIAAAYALLGLFDHAVDSPEFIFHLLESLSFPAVAIMIRFYLSAFQKKSEEHKELNLKLDGLNRELFGYNKKLEAVVQEKTRASERALAETQKTGLELKKQKAAILNILEDVNEERYQTLIEKEKLSRILQSIGDGVLAVDADKKVVLFNHVAEEITGYLAGEVAGRPYEEFFKLVYEKNGVANDIINRVFITKSIQQLTGHTLLLSKSGKLVPVADSAAPIFDQDGKLSGCIIVFRDVTREREIERQKSEFVSVASHQLRTPLTSIKWFLEMMLDGDAGKLNKEQIDIIKQVSESNERMIDLVNKLLSISRIEEGRMQFSPAPTNLDAMIRNIAREFMPQLKEGKLKFSLELAKLPILTIDPKLIREVFNNLLSNAIKYSPAGGAILLKAEPARESVIFSVKDNGIGVPRKQHSKMFHKFFRAENAVVRETEGTGMGLYVCKSIVELSGGKIWFKSDENKGSTFFFSLPIKNRLAKQRPKLSE